MGHLDTFILFFLDLCSFIYIRISSKTSNNIQYLVQIILMNIFKASLNGTEGMQIRTSYAKWNKRH